MLQLMSNRQHERIIKPTILSISILRDSIPTDTRHDINDISPMFKRSQTRAANENTKAQLHFSEKDFPLVVVVIV